MARRVRDINLETPNARNALPRQAGKPHYRTIAPGLHIGYRRNKAGGQWVMRQYDDERRAYSVKTVAATDDILDADGVTILSFFEAQELIRAKVRQQAGHRAGPYLVKDAIEDHIEWLAAHKKTAGDARYSAEALILPALGDIEVDKLTAGKIRAWLKQVAETPPRVRVKNGDDPCHRKADNSAEGIRRRRASANRVLATLKASLNRAWREKKVSSDDEWRRVQPFGDVDRPRVRYLTVAEAQRLINASDPDFRLLILAALQSAARYGEICRLVVDDYNPDNGTLAIRISKSGHSRHIVLTAEGQQFFTQATAGRAGDDIMFRKANGTVWRKGHQARPMADACKRARISPPITFHGLRHSWASLAIMNGLPLMVAAKNLGHADTKMVERTYGHLSDEYVAAEIRKNAPSFGVEADNVRPLRAG